MKNQLLLRFNDIKPHMDTWIGEAKSFLQADSLREGSPSKFAVAGSKSPVSVNFDDIEQDLEVLRAQWDSQTVNALCAELRTKTLASVVGPFGLGKILAAWEKDGGNVTTVNNAKNNVYAKEDQRYDRDDYCGGKFQAKSKDYRDNNTNWDTFESLDEYTGNRLYYKTESNRSATQTDHIVSTKEYHENGGFIQTTSRKRAFAENEGNFAATSVGINASAQDQDKLKWAASPNANDPQKTNAEYYGIDMDLLKAAYERGRKTAEAHAPTRGDWVVYYGKELTLTGLKESGKVGVSQACGVVILHFFEGVLWEINDLFTTDSGRKGVVRELKMRLKRVAQKVLAQWKEVWRSFSNGALSGFFSNLLTTFINTFITTAKRIVRMIREGVTSFAQAAKLLLFRPAGMTFSETADAAVKLLVGGGVTCVGVLLEETLEKALLSSIGAIPVLGAIVPQIAAVLTGCLTGLAGALAVYALNRLDFFGVNERKRHAYVITTLEESITRHERGIAQSIATVTTSLAAMGMLANGSESALAG